MPQLQLDLLKFAAVPLHKLGANVAEVAQFRRSAYLRL